MHSIPLKIRLLHIFLFELCALIIVTPLAALFLHTNIGHMLVLTLVVSIIASIWNLSYNMLFDIVEAKCGGNRKKRGALFRIFHTSLFEAGLIILTVPIIAYWLNLSLFAAFVVDIVFVVFFLVYAYFFNWIFDYFYFSHAEKMQAEND